MPIGLLSNCAGVFVGGTHRARPAENILTERMKEVLTMIFGVAAIANGIVSVIKVESMPPAILAVIVGTFLGELIQLEQRVKGGLHWILGKASPVRRPH